MVSANNFPSSPSQVCSSYFQCQFYNSISKIIKFYKGNKKKGHGDNMEMTTSVNVKSNNNSYKITATSINDANTNSSVNIANNQQQFNVVKYSKIPISPGAYICSKGLFVIFS